MKCEKCKQNEATVFYREVINGKEKRYQLCSACAAKKEEENSIYFAGFPSADLLGSLFSPLSIGVGGSITETKKCPLCASDFSFIAENGKVGCPECYKTFESELEATLRRLHGGALHRGRVPGKISDEQTGLSPEKKLEGELRAAITNEEYEKAAEIRDKLKEMRAQGE